MRAELPPAAKASATDQDYRDVGHFPPAPPLPPPGEAASVSGATPPGVDWLDPDGPITGQVADLNEASLLGPVPPAPDRGWRRAVHRMSGGAVNPGISAGQRQRIELLARIRTPNLRCQRVAVVSLKGGIGKTTTVAVLGATLAAMRGDRVVAVDANADGGTLAARVAGGHSHTARTLLAELPQLTTYARVRCLLEQGPSRLHVLAGDQDPAVSQAFSDTDYRAVSDILGRYYDIVLTDCGTGLLHSAMSEVLDLADSLIVVGSVSVDGAQCASRTLDWLDAHAYGHLVRDAHVVLSGLRPAGRELNADRIEGHFQARCGSVFTIPFDPHLATGATIDLDALKSSTRAAYLRLAAAIAGGFARQ